MQHKETRPGSEPEGASVTWWDGMQYHSNMLGDRLD